MQFQTKTLGILAVMLPGLAFAAAGAGGLPIKVREAEPGLLAKAAFPAAKAFKLADAQVPGGMVVEAEIEKEKYRLVYSFDVKVPGKEGVTEVHIDAMTGEFAGEDAEDDEADQKTEARRAANARVMVDESAPGLLAKASFSRDDAFSKIEALVPQGLILAAALEQEGRTLLYAFDVSVEGKPGIEDIDISAKTGKLLHWEHLSPAQYKREKLADDNRARAQKAKAAK